MHPTKHPPLPNRGPYHSPNQLNYFSSLNTLALTQTDHHEELADDATDLTHSPIPTYTISDPAALMSRMTTTADPDRDPSASSPASSMASSRGRAKGKTKMLDKFGSLGKKVVKEVLGGTGNNYRFPPSNANLSTFGRGGAARPKVRVYGATPMPLPANQTLSLISTDAANPYANRRRLSVDAVSQPWNGGLAVQVDTVITSSGSATSALGEDRLLLPGATRGLGSSSSSRDPSSASVAGPLPLPFSGPEPPRQPRLAVAPKPKVGAEQGDMSSVLKPDSDGPRTVRGGMDNLVLCNNNEGREGPLHGSINVQREEAKRILDDSFSSSSSSFPPSSSASASAPPLVPPRSFHATTTTAATSTFSQNQPQNLEGTMSTPTRSRRTHSGSVSPLPQPALPLNTKPKPSPTTTTPITTSTTGHPYAFLSSPPHTQTSTSKLDRRASTMTTTTTISHPRTTASAKSLARRPPPLQLHPDQVFYPRAQLPEQKAYGSGLLEEEEGDGRGTSPAGVVSEWWDDEEDVAAAALQSPGVVRRGVTPAGSCVVEVGSRATTVVPTSAGRDGRGVVRVDDTYEMDGDRDGDGLLSLVEFVDEDAAHARVGRGRKDEHQHQQRRQHQPPVVGLHQEGGETKHTRRPLPTLPPQVPQQPGHSRQVSYAQASSLQPQHHQLVSNSTSNSHGSTQSRTTTSDTHLPPQPDPSTSSIPPNPTANANANANALLIQNALAMLTAAAPPPTTAGGLPTSPLLNFGLPFQPQAQPQLAYGPLSPLLGATLGQHPQQQQQQPALSLGGTAGLELLVALANQNLRLMAAVEQQRLDLQQQQQQQQQRRQEDVASEAEGLGLDTRPQDVTVSDADASSSLSPSPASPRQARTSTSRSPARSSTSTPSSSTNHQLSSSSSSSSSSSKRASLAQSQQTPTPPVSPRGRIGTGTSAHGTRSSSIASSLSSSSSSTSTAGSTASTSGFAKRAAIGSRPTPPPLKARISTPKLGRPFRISLSTVLGRDEDEEAAAASSSSRPNPPPPVPPLPASVRGQPEAHARLSDYEADDDHEDDEGEDTEAEDRPKSWMAAEVKGLEQLVLGGGDTTEIETETEADVETETETETAAESTPRATAMGGLKSPGLFSVSTGTTAVDTLRSSRKSGFEYDSERAASPKKGDPFGAKPAPPSQTPVPFPKSPARSREMSGFASAAYAMRPGGGSGTGRTLSTLSRLAPPGWERPRESFDSLDSFDSFASTVSSNGGAMDLEELSIMTAHVFS